MTIPEGRDELVAAAADWTFPSSATIGDGVVDVEGTVHHFSRELAQWAVSQMPDPTLAAIASTVLGHGPVGARRLVARRARAYVRDVLDAAGVTELGATGDPAESLRELGNTVAFADVIDASIKADGTPNAWRHHAFKLWDGLEQLGNGRSGGWQAPSGGGEFGDWIAAAPDELDEARARLLIAMLSTERMQPSQRLVGFVRAHLSRADELAAAVVARKTFDTEVLTTVLGVGSPAIAEGAL